MHAQTHTQKLAVGLLLTSVYPFAEAATYTTQNKHKRINMPSAGFETAIPAIEKLPTYACSMDWRTSYLRE
jgi:hypothetical protein